MKRGSGVLVGLLVVGLLAPAGAFAVPGGPGVRANKAATRTQRAPSSRMLEDIHIEGEIPVPQVLFITARDQRRFMGFQHRRYLRTSRQLGEATPFPQRLVTTGFDDRKEPHR